MPFLDTQKKIIDCVFLQVQKLTKLLIKKINLKNENIWRTKRVCLFTSPKPKKLRNRVADSTLSGTQKDGVTVLNSLRTQKDGVTVLNSLGMQKASVTIEATIAMSVFILIVMFMGSFAVTINTEMAVQIGINNIARDVAMEKFYAGAISEAADNSETLSKDKEKINEIFQDDGEESLEWEDAIESGFNTVYLTAKLTAYEDSEESGAYEFSSLKNFDMTESSISDGMVDVVVRYDVKLPLLSSNMSVCQRARVKDWTGSDLTKEAEIVYITESGTVYHRSRQCSHLNISVNKTTYGELNSLRNEGGKKYSKCSYCVDGKLSSGSTIYVTEDGTKYHTDLQCQGLTRKIIEIDIEQVGDRKPCGECGQGE